MTTTPLPGEFGRRLDAWHAAASDEALAALGSLRQGLPAAEVARRLPLCGPNRLPQAARRGPLLRFLLQFHNVFIYVLLASAVVSAALLHLVDALVILGVVVINAIVGFLQEGRAESALEAIRGMIDPRTTVLREGRRQTIAAEDLVPGDLVLLEPGDRVPADLRLVRARNLRIAEAVLTGESVPADKSAEPVRSDAPLADRSCMAYSGTLVAAGQGTGVAVATGPATELGRISRLISEVQTLETPLIREMDRFARQLTLGIVAVSVVVFLVALFLRGYGADEAFVAVVALAVAAIPEGLPAVLTIVLAIGVRRMARRNAIVRRLPAVETLGSVSVICSDKTGTLTRNEMMVRGLVTGDALFEVTGSGYAPVGEFLLGDREVEPAESPALLELARVALLCNDAELREGPGGWTVDGDPMEGALVSLGIKAGLDPERTRRDLPRDDEIPFDAAHRFMATLHHSHEDGTFILVKGAPERVLRMCDAARRGDGVVPLDIGYWQAMTELLAGDGQRVLAFATRSAPPGKRELAFSDLDGGATLLGLAGLIDPPRDEAIAAVRDCATAGIRVVMITGDHAATARAVARQLGLGEEPKASPGSAIDGLDDDELRALAREVTVFARTTPEHKLRLVEALQAEGLVVAMTGDGVNDAPALKRADVGVAMGGKGTEAAKEAAEMVLADDNFASIVAAVREGRTVYDNMVKVIGWTLPTNGGEGLAIVAAIALGVALPITPLQILWVNMIAAVTLGLTLAFEPTEPGTMQRRPRPAGRPILSPLLVWRVVFAAVLFVIGVFGLFYAAREQGLGVEEARTIAVNTLVAMQVFYLFSVRYVRGAPFTWTGVVGTPAVLAGVAAVAVAQALFTWWPPMQAVFDTRPIGWQACVAIVASGFAMLAVLEVERRIVAWAATALAPRAGSKVR